MLEVLVDRPRYVELPIPVAALILAFTAIPTELRSVSAQSVTGIWNLNLDLPDIVANLLGYIPLGAALAGRTRSSTLIFAAAVSFFAEATQIFTNGRSPSLVDVTTNVIGAAIGLTLSARWNIVPTRLAIGRRTAVVAAALVVAYIGFGARVTIREFEDVVAATMEAPPWRAVNARGFRIPGRLEAHWPFDAVDNGTTPDTSGNRLHGTFVNEPTFVAGVKGLAVVLNGVDQWVDLGDPTELRLAGSMTVGAWINASAFPRDDAAIVSDHSGLGYQLDTTVDEGPRTIGFKLANASGQLMARYGTTPLTTNHWYHVAGIYDAAAKTLNVYLNGRLDNGCLVGHVTTRQHISGAKAFLGRRGSGKGFEFAGAIDDARIYSRALTQLELDAVIEDGIAALRVPANRTGFSSDIPDPNRSNGSCRAGEPTDARVAGLVVAHGMLAAIVLVGVWPWVAYRTPCIVFSFVAGVLLLPSMLPLLPRVFQWIVPLLSLAGGAVVAASARQ